MAFLLERRRRRRRYLVWSLVPRWVFYLVHERIVQFQNSSPLRRGKSGTAEWKVEQKFSTFFFFLFQDWFWASSLLLRQQRNRELRARVKNAYSTWRFSFRLRDNNIGKFYRGWQDGNDDTWCDVFLFRKSKILPIKRVIILYKYLVM